MINEVMILIEIEFDSLSVGQFGDKELTIYSTIR